jgi:hypothetical protein
MKAKKLEKKLVIRKTTVANLSDTDMNRLKGGIKPSTSTCPGCLTIKEP